MAPTRHANGFPQHQESPIVSFHTHTYWNSDFEKTIYILPGDCFPAAAYSGLAKKYFEEGVNVHILDYLAASREKVADRQLNHRACAEHVIQLIREVHAKYPSTDMRSEKLLGHSRGAYIAIGALAAGFRCELELHAPYLGPNYSSRPPWPLLLELGFKFCLGRPLRLSYYAFRRRMFPAGTPPEIVRSWYERSIALSKGLLLDKIQFNLEFLKGVPLSVSIYADDHVAESLRIRNNLAAILDTNVIVSEHSGGHCQLLGVQHAGRTGTQ